MQTNANAIARKGQGGFTLIEVIAVLVIVGMLAAVAIPKYLDLQTDAARNAVRGALAAGASNVTMLYSQQLLTGNFTTNAALVTALNNTPYTNVGDFTVGYAAGTGTYDINVTVSASSVTSLNSQLTKLAAADLTKTVTYAN